MCYETGVRGDALDGVQGSWQRRRQRHLIPGNRYRVGFQTRRGAGPGIFELPYFPFRLRGNNSRPGAAGFVRWEEHGVALVDFHKNRKGEPLQNHKPIARRRRTAENIRFQRVRKDFHH